MKDEYDFSKGERGKFYSAEAEQNIPIFLDVEVRQYFSERAQAKGVGLQAMVNELLKKNIALIEAIK